MRLTLVLLVAAAVVVHAQGIPPQTGSLAGRVDAAGAPVRHARVVLQQEGLGVVASTATDADGRFAFEQLAPGTYLVRAEKPGFVSRSTEGEPAPAAILENVYPWVLRQSSAVEVTAAKLTTVSLVLERGAAIEGSWRDPRYVRNGRVLQPQAVMMNGTPVIGMLGLAPTPATAPIVERIMVTASGQTQSTRYPATADDLGRFRVPSLPPGQYVIYVSLVAGGAPFNWYYPGTTQRENAQLLTLAPGQTFLAGEFALPAEPAAGRGEAEGTPRAPEWDSVIEGRVLDEFGDPAPWIMVQLLERRFLAGRFRLMPLGWRNGNVNYDARANTRSTDDLGRFRFDGLAAGDYYLAALPEPFGRSDHPPETDELSGFMPAFFPDATSKAQPVRVNGADAAPDLTLVLTPARTGTIKGSVLTAQGGPERDLTSFVRLAYAPGGEVLPAAGAQHSVQNGGFLFRHVPAGEYVLQMLGAPPASVVVAPDTTTEITLQRRASVNIRGRIVFDGDGPRPRPGDVAVGREPLSPTTRMMYGARGPQRVDPDWTFWNLNGWPGVIRADLPPGWALTRTTLNGEDITDKTVDFASDTDGIEVVLTSRLGAASGVLTSNGMPTSAYGVAIFGDDRARLSYPSRFIHLAKVDQQGRFAVTDLLPGRYLALTLPDNRHDGVEVEWLDTMRPFAVPVEIIEGRTTEIALRLR